MADSRARLEELRARARLAELRAKAGVQGAEAASAPQQQAAPQQAEQPKTLADMAAHIRGGSGFDMLRSLPGGLLKGAAAMAGLPGDLQQLIVGQKTPLGPPGSQQIGETIAAPAGGFYQPQTTAGQYAETAMSFAPAALSPGSAPMRAARVVIPSVASETAGQLTKDTPYEPYARMGGAILGGGLTELGGAAARPLTRVANKAVEQVRGRGFLNPETEAVRRIQEAINREGGTGRITQALNEWAQTDASNPALIDVSGGNVRRLVRAAAGGSEGNAQNLAQQYLDRIQAGIQDEASRITRALPPTNTPLNAGQYSDDLTNMQQHMAQNEYRAPYAQPASVTPEMVSALQGSEGRAAIGRAIRGASANRDAKQLGELRDLLAVAGEQGGGRNPLTGQVQSLEQALSGLSSGSLDRVRIAMREMGGAHARAGHGDIARGLRGRVGDIDTALDQTPGLTDARASYRQNQAMIDAVEHGRTGTTQPSSAYVPELQRLQSITPQSQIGAGVGYRQGLLDSIERPAAGATGALNRIASAPQQTENLTATFGQPTAQRYQQSIGNEISRLRNARGISPNTGSQTALRSEEMALVDALPFGQKAGMVAKALDLLKRGLSLTEAEKEAIVRLGTTEADLRRVLQNAPPRTSALAIAQRLLISAPAAAAVAQ
jgi:hypothetical protein